MAHLKRKALLMAVIEVLCLAILGLSLFQMQTNISLDTKKASIEQKLAQVPELVTSAYDREGQIYTSYDEVYQAKANAAVYMVRNFDDFELTTAQLEAIRSEIDVTNVIIVDRQGNIKAKATSTPANFTRARFNRLFEAFEGKVPYPFGIEYSTGTRSYFSAKIDAASMLIVEQDPTEVDELLSNVTGWEPILSNVKIGVDGYAFAVSAQDYTFSYHPNAELSGSDALASGIRAEDLEEGNYCWMTIDGISYYCGVTLLDDTYVICAVSRDEITSSRNITVGIILFIFFTVITIVITYAMFLLQEDQLHASNWIPVFKRKPKPGADPNAPVRALCYFNKSVGVKISAVAAIGLVCILGVSFYMQTLYSLSITSMSNDQRAEEVEGTIARYKEEQGLLLSQYNKRYVNKAQIAAYILEHKPELATVENLEELSAALDVEWISVFDAEGKMGASNSPYNGFTLSTDPAEQSYMFRSLLNGAMYVIQDAQQDELSGEFRQYIGAALPVDCPVGRFIQIAVAPSALEETMSGISIASTLSNVRVGNRGFAFAVNKETHAFDYYPTDKLVGRNAFEYGMRETDLRDDFCDYLTIAGERFYGSAMENDDDYIFVVVPNDEVSKNSLSITLATAGISFICLLLTVLVLAFSRKPGFARPKVVAAAEAEAEESAAMDVVLSDGTVKRTVSAASRWDNSTSKWRDFSPEQKTGKILGWFMGALAVCVGIIVLIGGTGTDSGSIFNYVLKGGWQRGINIFAATSAILYLCVIVVIAAIVSEGLRILSRTLDARGDTVCRLMRSFVKYGAVIVALYVCLAQFGVDTATLLASAGILSLVIGLGAQKLVSDVVAGLFLIFEGEFRVGDIVTVGGWRGVVQEIGVRTTKIEDNQHNVKILNNSEVSGLVNMTRKYSVAVCDVTINAPENIEHLEKILDAELPAIQKRLPAIKFGPFYDGVISISPAALSIRVSAECSESDRFQLQYDLNREMKLLCDKHGINK